MDTIVMVNLLVAGSLTTNAKREEPCLPDVSLRDRVETGAHPDYRIPAPVDVQVSVDISSSGCSANQQSVVLNAEVSFTWPDPVLRTRNIKQCEGKRKKRNCF